MEQEYLANIMAKDREIAELRAEVSKESGAMGGGVLPSLCEILRSRQGNHTTTPSAVWGTNSASCMRVRRDGERASISGTNNPILRDVFLQDWRLVLLFNFSELQ